MTENRSRRPSRSARPSVDPARRAAFDVLRSVHADDGYANLLLPRVLRRYRLSGRDAAFATELVAGSCRMQGSYDLIIEAAADRTLSTLQPAVVDLLRLGAHQVLGMRVPAHAAVAATVDLAAATVGRRVTGLTNAVLRRIAERDLDGWLELLSRGMDERDALALRYAHPRWIVDAFAEQLPVDELEPALAADNKGPQISLAVRPGLAEPSELLAAGAEPGLLSPFAARWSGDPSDVPAVADGRAGVQDEGSQLAALALARVDAPQGPWLDLAAGPGGKTALLAGLAEQRGEVLVASEIAPHRAALVARALAGYPPRPTARQLIIADGRRPAWRPGRFTRVLADVPCTGLGALRRRPEARWRRRPESLGELTVLQAHLLHTAIDSACAGGVIGYVTCSPHRRETTDVVAQVMADRDDVEQLPAGSFLPEITGGPGFAVQLWPHRHGTDAMFIALIRRKTSVNIEYLRFTEAAESI